MSKDVKIAICVVSVVFLFFLSLIIGYGIKLDKEKEQREQQLLAQQNIEQQRLAEEQKLEQQKLAERRRIEQERIAEEQRLEQQRIEQAKLSDPKYIERQRLAEELRLEKQRIEQIERLKSDIVRYRKTFDNLERLYQDIQNARNKKMTDVEWAKFLREDFRPRLDIIRERLKESKPELGSAGIFLGIAGGDLSVLALDANPHLHSSIEDYEQTERLYKGDMARAEEKLEEMERTLNEAGMFLDHSLIPEDVTYTIIKGHTISGIKRSLDIRINRKVSEEVLREIAYELKERDPREYERTFIAYLLPGMVDGAGAWATTYFDPDLEINIMGMTVDDEKYLLSKTDDPNRKIIGKWLDETPFFSNKTTLYMQDGKIYMEKRIKDGNFMMEEMVEKPSNLGRRFQEKKGNDFGEYYVIDKEGNLQIRDQDGLISTAKKIN